MSELSDFFAGPGGSGKLVKLTIYAFEDPEQANDAETKAPESFEDANVFEALYNPASYSASYALKYTESKELAGSQREMRYNGYDTTTYSFDLILDGTGASVPDVGIYSGKDKQKTVPQMVDKFMAVAYGFDGNTHRGSYLQLRWGASTIAKCVLASASITYELFKPDGTPLRAKIACSFKEYSYKELKDAEGKVRSPDMTHIRVVKQGDKLPLMCERIYGDANLYPQVARHNKLRNYRNLKPGQKIYFPPLVAAKS